LRDVFPCYGTGLGHPTIKFIPDDVLSIIPFVALRLVSETKIIINQTYTLFGYIPATFQSGRERESVDIY